MSIFDRLDRMTSRVVDRTFSTAFACQPMLKRPNARPEVDPDRAPWEGVGILEEEPEDVDVDVDIGARNRSNDLHTLVTGHSHELSVDRVRYPSADAARQGDVIIVGSRKFSVSVVRRDGLSRVVFGLVRR